jgi:2-iminobutanoate/2-iminopropanoate deaminase
MSIERLTTNPASGFSDAVTAVGPGRLIHVSGSVGFGPDGKVVAGGLGAEARATLDNIERTLGEAGADMSHVVKINAFVTSLDEYSDYAAARAERFGEKLPASATVQVAGLLVGAHIEIDAVAFVPDAA